MSTFNLIVLEYMNLPGLRMQPARLREESFFQPSQKPSGRFVNLCFFKTHYLKHADNLSLFVSVFGGFFHTMTEAVTFTYSGYEAAKCNYSYKFLKA